MKEHSQAVVRDARWAEKKEQRRAGMTGANSAVLLVDWKELYKAAHWVQHWAD